jgi:drug/metabolite transporter (DMT)-like permease
MSNLWKVPLATIEKVDNINTARRVASETAALQPVDWLLLAVPGIIWGSSFYFIAIGLDSFSPGLITPMRVLIGFLTLSAFPKARAPIPRSAWLNIALLGVVWLAIPLSAFPFAEQHVSSSVIGMLNGASPLFVALVAIGISRLLPPRGQVLGLGIGLVGVFCIALPTINQGSSSTFGTVLVLGALTLYGVALNVAAPLQREFGALPVLWRAQIVAVVLLAPMGIYSLRNSEFAWRPFAAVVVLGVFGTAMAHYAIATLAGRIGSTRASASLYLMPAVSLFLGVVLRGEDVAVLAIFGSAVAVLGAWVLGRSKRSA